MFLLAAATLLTAMPAPGQGQDTPATPKKERKICKDAQVSATRMGSSRICKTASEWRAESDNAVETLDRQRQEMNTPRDGLTAG
jgi:hypothetical protein